MFCPKCATENPDNGKFCRSCGANLSNVLAAVEGDFFIENTSAKGNEIAQLRSTAIRNIILGFGFLAAAGAIFTILPRDGFYWLLLMIPGFWLLASGISRWIKGDTLRNERKTKAAVIRQPSFDANRQIKELPPTKDDYVRPAKYNNKTKDLVGEPHSVIEETTRHLKLD